MPVRKVTLGTDNQFRLVVAGYCAASTITLTVRWPAGDETYTLNVERSADRVTEITQGRIIGCAWGGLTPAAPASWAIGVPNPAWLDCDGFGQFPVRVLRVTDDGTVADPDDPSSTIPGGALELADSLPSAVAEMPDGAEWYLRWPAYVGIITQGTIPASPMRPVSWSASYTRIIDGASRLVHIDRGELALVRVPFDTGLTHDRLLALCPAMSGMEPQGQAGWSRQIESGLDTLVTLMCRRLDRDVYEDQIGGSQFETAHALAVKAAWLTTICDMGHDRVEARDDARKELTAELDAVFSRLEWLDADDDGVVDSGEGATENRWVEVGSIGRGTACRNQQECGPRRDVRDVW